VASVAVLASMLGAAGLSQASDAAPGAGRCAALAADMARPGMVISGSAIVPAGPGSAPPGATAPLLPEHCLFSGTIAPRVGEGGREFGIGFELRMPTEWSGRFLFQGGGGLDGVVLPAVGAIANSAGQPALARGIAVVSTDSGHRGSPIDATFGHDQQARTDYAYNALDKVTLEAKRVIAAFYGSAPRHSYFLGCSNGGRQALVASQRLPLEFDGIVAGDPAMSFSRLALHQVWSMGVVARIAPRDEQGRPIYARAFSDGDLQLVRTEVLRQCDALDNLADGMINDWQACGFEPAQLVCSGDKTDSCLSQGQADVLRDLFAGPKDSGGRHLYGPFTFDTGVASSAWRGMRLGTSQTGEANSADSSLGLGQFRHYQLTPAEPDFDPLQPMDIEALLERIRHTGAMGDGDSPLLSTFALRSKMIVYNGMSDQGMATQVMVDWYQRMIDATGQKGADAVRLFAVPGMLHCGGGEATDKFEMLDAIIDWVEHDKPPERIIASGSAFPGRTRPLCPFPQVARYTGGDPEAAESFQCRT
jgi:feruloyl esterase